MCRRPRAGRGKVKERGEIATAAVEGLGATHAPDTFLHLPISCPTTDVNYLEGDTDKQPAGSSNSLGRLGRLSPIRRAASPTQRRCGSTRTSRRASQRAMQPCHIWTPMVQSELVTPSPQIPPRPSNTPSRPRQEVSKTRRQWRHKLTRLSTASAQVCSGLV
jgi:hypothetical protein